MSENVLDILQERGFVEQLTHEAEIRELLKDVFTQSFTWASHLPAPFCMLTFLLLVLITAFAIFC